MIKPIGTFFGALMLLSASAHAGTFNYRVKEDSGIFELRNNGQLTTGSMQAQVGTFEGLTTEQIRTSDVASLFNAWRPLGDNNSNVINFSLGGSDWSDIQSASSISPVDDFDLANQRAYFWGVSGAFPGNENEFSSLNYIIIEGNDTAGNNTAGFPTGIPGPDPRTTFGEFALQAISDPASQTLVGSFVPGQEGGTYNMIPEPNAITLLLLGLGGTLLFRRRRA